MKSRRHIVTSAAIFVGAAAFIGILVWGLSLDQRKVPSAILGKPAKDFQVSWIQGNEHVPQAGPELLKLSDLRGKPVVLNFWASWCVSCREEARELEAFWQSRGSDLVVVGIAIQDEKDSAMRFAKMFGKTYILALDVDGKAAIDYGVSGVPETFLIDREGIIRHKEVGPVTASMLRGLVSRIM